MTYLLMSTVNGLMGLFDSLEAAKKAGDESVVRAMSEIEHVTKPGYYVMECAMNTYNYRVHYGEDFGRQALNTPEQFPLSTEMCGFLGIPEDTWMSRTECTRRIVKYIKDNSLELQDNRRVIIPDEKLKTVLRGETITYFNIQKAMAHNFKGYAPEADD